MKVYIMIGLIGSGKSAWARLTAGCDFNTIRVGIDDIRDMIKDRYTFDFQLEPLVRKMGTAMIVQVLLEGKNVVVDDCHLTEEHRQELCAMIKGAIPEAEIIYVWMRCDSTVALKRRLSNLRGGTEFGWIQVMKKHEEMFDIPTKNENKYVSDMIEVFNG